MPSLLNFILYFNLIFFNKEFNFYEVLFEYELKWIKYMFNNNY